jgi:gas vesicle protein
MIISPRRGIIVGLLIGSIIGGAAGATILTASEAHAHELTAQHAQIAPAGYPSTT